MTQRSLRLRPAFIPSGHVATVARSGTRWTDTPSVSRTSCVARAFSQFSALVSTRTLVNYVVGIPHVDVITTHLPLPFSRRTAMSLTTRSVVLRGITPMFGNANAPRPRPGGRPATQFLRLCNRLARPIPPGKYVVMFALISWKLLSPLFSNVQNLRSQTSAHLRSAGET